MRIIPILALPALLVACGTETELRHMSTLQAETSGVALSADGTDAYAAMSGTTCQLDTSFGCPTSDADLPTDAERIVDHWNGMTLGSSDQGVHLIRDQVWQPEQDLAVTRVRTAKLTAEGTVVLAGDDAGCSLTSSRGSADVPAVLCQDGVSTDVNRSLGVMFVATGEGVYRVSDRGAERIGGAADLVSTDEVTGAVFSAAWGSDTLTATDADGTPLWTRQVDGTISSIASRGDRGDLLILVDTGTFGAVERRSAEDGELEGSSSVPAVTGVLVASDSGHTVGIVLPDQIQWYALEVDGEEGVIDRDTPSCMQGWSRDNAGFVAAD